MPHEKILVLSNMYPSSKNPHYGVFVKKTVELLNASGCRTKVISLKKTKNKLLRLAKYLVFYVRAFFSILFCKYDCVYAHYASHTALPILAAHRLKNVKIITNVHGNDVVPEDERDQRFLKLTEKLLQNSNAVIVPSQYFFDIVEKEYGVPKNKIYVFPSGGVDMAVFKKMDKRQCREEISLKYEDFVIGYAGRIEIGKGWDILLNAFKAVSEKMPNAKLLVVGDGDERQLFENKIIELKLENSVLQFNLLPQDELAKMLNCMDLFVFPTYRKSESLGLIGLEAMACEIVTILPDKYGPTSYGIDEHNCFMFRSGDAKSLSKTIFRAMNESSEKLKNNAIATVKEYDINKMETILGRIFMCVLQD